jgi:hypothetical protein
MPSRYIQFILLAEGEDVVRRAAYAKTVHDGFSSGGRPMLTRRNDRIAGEEIAQRKG